MTKTPGDVRGRGFPTRAPLAEAVAWVDARTAALPCEDAEPAPGRVLGGAVTAPEDRPAAALARCDGWAVRAEETLGAGAYNPLPLAARAVAAGEALPPDTDAVVPVTAAEASPLGVEVVEALAPGSGVLRRGEEAAAGAALLPAGRVLRPQDVALLAALGMARAPLVRVPRVRIVLAGGPRGHAAETNAALLSALVARDGGTATRVGPLGDGLEGALSEPGADLVLLCGRCGVGPDDGAPMALAAAGELALHGLALRPGGSGGLGVAGGVPVVLLPGEPAAAWAVYETLAGRAVRRLAGRPAGMPHAAVVRPAARKLVSEIGMSDLYRVRLGAAGVEPVASAAVPGLAALARADGFVLIPPDSEGIAPGGDAKVLLFDGGDCGLWLR